MLHPAGLGLPKVTAALHHAPGVTALHAASLWLLGMAMFYIAVLRQMTPGHCSHHKYEPIAKHRNF